MPVAVLKVQSDAGIYRAKDANSTSGDLVSNFTLSFQGTVELDRDAGGPGFLARIKRFPDAIQRYMIIIAAFAWTHDTYGNAIIIHVCAYRDCFLPMSELSGNTKQLCTYLNQVFPGGALFLVASDTEVKRFMMEMTTLVLQNQQRRKVAAARVIGINPAPTGEEYWVFSPTCVMSVSGNALDQQSSPIMWLERPSSTSSNIIVNESLVCHIASPLDHGEAYLELLDAVQAFMPENFLPPLAAIASTIMAASYKKVIAQFGCIGVPVLFGDPCSCSLNH